jgi:hypothetical protein
MDEKPEILAFVKAMSDADRLRIIGVLTKGPAWITPRRKSTPFCAASMWMCLACGAT